MFIDPPVATKTIATVALHCTPKGVRAFCWCRGYKHGTPNGVVGSFYE